MCSFFRAFYSPVSSLAVVLMVAQASLAGQAPTKPSTSAKPAAAQVYVAMPKEIQCGFKNIETEGIVGSGEMHQLNGSVEGLFCWFAAAGSESAKEVLLASSKIVDGKLSTKSFGVFHVAEVGSADNRADSFHDVISILRGELPSFRAFLRAPVAASSHPADSKPNPDAETLEGTLVFGFTAKVGATGDTTMTPSGLSIDANGKEYGILLSAKTKVPDGWNPGGVSAIEPGRYSVHGRVYGDQIQADEITYLGK